jgi:hypothetical protein
MKKLQGGGVEEETTATLMEESCHLEMDKLKANPPSGNALTICYRQFNNGYCTV